MANKISRSAIAFLPGTGVMGAGLARMFGGMGHSIFIGSRDPVKATQTVERLHKEVGKLNLQAGDHHFAASKCEIAFWCVHGPLEQRHTLLSSLKKELEGKIIVDVTNVMYFFNDKHWGQISSTEQNRDVLGVPARWVSAFKTSFAKSLLAPIHANGTPHETQICSDDLEATKIVSSLINEAGYRALNCGPLKNTRIIELMGPPFIGEVDRLNNGKFSSAWRFT